MFDHVRTACGIEIDEINCSSNMRINENRWLEDYVIVNLKW